MQGVQQRIVDGALRMAAALLTSLPPRALHAVARASGALWWAMDGRRRRRGCENLRAAFGDALSPRARRRWVATCFRNLLNVPFETLLFQRLLGTERQLLRRCELKGDWPALRQDVQAGRAGLLLGAHLGNWELGVHALGVLDIPHAVVVRPIDHPALNALATARRGGPDRVIPHRGAGGGLGPMRRALTGGRWLGMLADQNAGHDGVFVPFFGLPASAHASPMRLAQHLDVPVYLAVSIRGAVPWTYDLHLVRLHVETDEAPGARDALARSVRGYHQVLERLIDLAPTQYNWLHRRWRHRPPDEAPNERLPRYDHHRATMAPMQAEQRS